MFDWLFDSFFSSCNLLPLFKLEPFSLFSFVEVSWLGGSLFELLFFEVFLFIFESLLFFFEELFSFVLFFFSTWVAFSSVYSSTYSAFKCGNFAGLPDFNSYSYKPSIFPYAIIISSSSIIVLLEIVGNEIIIVST